MTEVKLVLAANSLAREAALCQMLPAMLAQHGNGIKLAILLEGLPAGHEPLTRLLAPTITLSRIAAGCLCCTGNLVLRVSLDRLLRSRPDWILIGPANMDHVPTLRAMLRAAPYDAWLTMGDDWLAQ